MILFNHPPCPPRSPPRRWDFFSVELFCPPTRWALFLGFGEFNCKDASVKSYGYNISVIVKKKKAKLPNLKFDNGDIRDLAEFFPFNATEGFNGQIQEWNW